METSVVLTLAELWLCNDVVRHDPETEREERARYPLVSTRLNEEIALAIHACVTEGAPEQTLWLTYAELLLIDAHVRRSMKTPEGASGHALLLKTFAARAKLDIEFLSSWPEAEEGDISYKEALARKEARVDAEPDNDPNTSTDTNSHA